MRIRQALVLSMLATALMANGVGQRAKGTKQRTLAVGEVFTVELKENVTTGYRWTIRNFQRNYLEPKEDTPKLESEKNTTHKPHLGAGGTYRASFVALCPGKTDITFEYRRPWEKDVPTKTITYSVVITK